eukprot:scaffold6456_cov147-Amphora_coffeaeformis.AAC.9
MICTWECQKLEQEKEKIENRLREHQATLLKIGQDKQAREQKIVELHKSTRIMISQVQHEAMCEPPETFDFSNVEESDPLCISLLARLREFQLPRILVKYTPSDEGSSPLQILQSPKAAEEWSGHGNSKRGESFISSSDEDDDDEQGFDTECVLDDGDGERGLEKDSHHSESSVLQAASSFLGSVLSRLDGSFDDDDQDVYTAQEIAEGWMIHRNLKIHNPASYAFKEVLTPFDDRAYWCEVLDCGHQRRSKFPYPLCVNHGGPLSQRALCIGTDDKGNPCTSKA